MWRLFVTASQLDFGSLLWRTTRISANMSRPNRREEGLVNIGWLDLKKPFRQGYVDPVLALRIGELCKTPVNRTRGFHGCGLCTEYPIRETIGSCGDPVRLGDAEIRVAGKGKTYVCPTLIYHYIVKHRYKPPGEFLSAIVAHGV